MSKTKVYVHTGALVFPRHFEVFVLPSPVNTYKSKSIFRTKYEQFFLLNLQPYFGGTVDFTYRDQFKYM